MKLSAAGSDTLKGLCPFHDEQTPSLNVNPGKGLWYCFGCSQGGDAIDFVRRVDGLTFVEAVEKLADAAGVELRYGGDGDDPSGSARRRLLALLGQAQQVAAEQYAGLPPSHPARTFLSGRGFDSGLVELFGVGFAPPGGLCGLLEGRGWSGKDFVDAGLAVERDGKVRDLFAGRLLWPIGDPAGRVVAFGGRRLSGQGPKYVNSPDSVLYSKSGVLFNLHRARREAGQGIVVVEGYTDVMAMHADGVLSAVAACGTAFGEGHVDLLRRTVPDVAGGAAGTSRVVFVFDGDAAGRAAAGKVSALPPGFARRAYIAVPPGGADPCDVRVSEGDGSLRALVGGAAPAAEYALSAALDGVDVDTVEGRAAGLEAVIPVLAGIRDDMLRASYDRWVSGRLGVEAWRVAAKVRDYSPKVPPAPGGGGSGAVQPAATVAGVEREALKCVLQHPAESAGWFAAVERSAFTTPAAVNIYDACSPLPEGGGGPGWVRGVAEKSGQVGLVEALTVEPLTFAGPATDVALHCEATLRLLIDADARRRVDALRAALSTLDAASGQFSEMYRELLALEAHRRELAAPL